jgi:hypothetical protein
MSKKSISSYSLPIRQPPLPFAGKKKKKKTNPADYQKAILYNNNNKIMYGENKAGEHSKYTEIYLK